MRPQTAAYSLIEVLIAGALIAMAIAAAALMANTMIMQEEANMRAVRGINIQEQVARLFYLGLDYDTITNILPEKCSTSIPPPDGSITLGLSIITPNLSGVGLVDQAECTIVYLVGEKSDGNSQYMTNVVTLIRPTIR